METENNDTLIECFKLFKSFFENYVLPNWKKGFKYFKDSKLLDIQKLNFEKHTYIRDPIWDEIRLNKLELTILDSFFVQRLRYITQMGGTKFVYPAAIHKRFDHSLGTFACISLILDEKILKRRRKYYKENINMIFQQYRILNPKIGERFELKSISSNELNKPLFRTWILLNLKCSMLMHDIGHYPFSHSFEIFLQRNYNLVSKYRTNEENFIKKPHEYRSKQIIIGNDPIINEFIDKKLTSSIKVYIEKHDLDLDLISKSITGEHSFVLSQIINGVLDADKMDYLTRDNYFAIASFPLNVFDRIYRRAKFKKIDESENIKMIFDDKAVSAILKIILTRTFEFNDIVNHPVNLCFQAMFNACLELTFQQYDLNAQIEILKRMELMNDEELLHSISILANGNERINDLLYRITFRKLYKQVGYYQKSKFPLFIELMRNAKKESLFIDENTLSLCLNEDEYDKLLSPLINTMKSNKSGILVFYTEYGKSISKYFNDVLIEIKEGDIISLKKIVDDRYREEFNNFLNYASNNGVNQSVADLFDFFSVLDDKIYIYTVKSLLETAKKFFDAIERDETVFKRFLNTVSECI